MTVGIRNYSSITGRSGLSIEIWFEKYRIITCLGSGGSADVFLAEHMALSAYRAVKRIPKAEKLHDFWLREAKILKNLSHPRIPVVYDLEEDSSYSYIIMEYLEGISLKTYRRKQEMTREEIQQIALQVCEVLRYLHEMEQPLLYLDLKPENLLVCNGNIKIVDFGAALLKGEWNTYGTVMGTRGYGAPELFEHGELDERSDIYSFGMLLFFLFTGEAPKRKKECIGNIDRLNDIGEGWKDIVNQCLKYVPGMRFSSMAGLEERMLFLMNQEPEKKEENGHILRVAGAVPHSGVTHVCFMLAVSFAEHGKRVAYREMEEHGVVESLLLWQGRKKKGKESVCLGVRLFRGEEEKEESEWFDLEVQDYGWIGKECAKYLFQMGHVLLISGVRCWEMRGLENILAKFKKSPLLCMNFVSGKEFFRLAGYYRNYVCLRIPYQPEISKDSLRQGGKFAQRVWEEVCLCLKEN